MRILINLLPAIFVFASVSAFAECTIYDKSLLIECEAGGFLGLGKPCTSFVTTGKYKFLVLARISGPTPDHYEIRKGISASRIIWDDAIKFNAANPSAKNRNTGLWFCFASDQEKGTYKMVNCKEALKYGGPKKGNC